jgi:serine phosphatase RsbU (regulator of sigma subunit)
MKYPPCIDKETGEICANNASLRSEIENFTHLLKPIVPLQGTMPSVRGVDIHGENIPLNEIGGDLLLFLDFNDRYNIPSINHEYRKDDLCETMTKAGVVIIDSSGHSATTSYLGSAFYYALATGLLYELEEYGHVTTGLFEKLNHIFYNQDGIFLTMTYGEISPGGVFRYIQASNPPPLVFSNEFERFMELGPDQLRSSLPIGVAPSESYRDTRHTLIKQNYVTNQIVLSQPGDLILLSTDGLSDHARGRDHFSGRLENIIRSVKDAPAKAIAHAIRDDVEQFAARQDDISFVVIKNTP